MQKSFPKCQYPGTFEEVSIKVLSEAHKPTFLHKPKTIEIMASVKKTILKNL